jgi:hypothetical protein
MNLWAMWLCLTGRTSLSCICKWCNSLLPPLREFPLNTRHGTYVYGTSLMAGLLWGRCETAISKQTFLFHHLHWLSRVWFPLWKQGGCFPPEAQAGRVGSASEWHEVKCGLRTERPVAIVGCSGEMWGQNTMRCLLIASHNIQLSSLWSDLPSSHSVLDF